MAPQQEFVLGNWETFPDTKIHHPTTHLELYSRDAEAAKFTFSAIRPNIFRTRLTTKTHTLPPHRSLPTPAINLENTHLCSWIHNGIYSLTLDHVVLEISFATGPPVLSASYTHNTDPLHADLPHRSYVLDGPGIAHYTRHKTSNLHVGLGEKAAPMDLTNRSFTLGATDSFGYDVHRSDPLYKNIPLLITASPEGCVGVFSTSHSRGFYSVGGEMDGMWGRYNVYRQDYGGLEEYIIIGHTLQEVVRSYADLVGYPRLLPRWAFGYLAGGMKYSMLDEPRASDALIEFAERMKKEDIPCSGFQMSSGYTVAEQEPKTRNVFTWNRHRFPDPKGFIKEFHDRGIRLIFNVKPYVLENHPEYKKLEEAGALFKDPRTGGSGKARLWSAGGATNGVGGHIDFTSKAGFRWWYEGVRELKKLGVDCIWNDNNEYLVPDDNWLCALDEPSLQATAEEKEHKSIGYWGRALQAELHGKSSHDAIVEVEPHLRPFILTRSATAGTMRYCGSSWSGDNVTSWDGMRGANALSLNAGMCLLQCYGHDIGGFEGPQPSPELLVRWIQLGIHSPRFAINCYKTSPDNSTIGEVIEPWMYPECTPLVRAAIRRRYELIPYLYSLHLESHRRATPPQRWVGWGYESDPEVWRSKLLKDGETQYWLGDHLLVGGDGIFQPGSSKARIYLPRRSPDDPGFIKLNGPCDYNKTDYFEAGKWVTVDATWDGSGVPIFARVGGAVPTGPPTQEHLDNWRAVEIFPPSPDGPFSGKTFESTWLEDDGVTPDAVAAEFKIKYRSEGKKVVAEVERHGGEGFEPLWKAVRITLPLEDRHETVELNGKPLEPTVEPNGRRIFDLVSN